MHQYLLGPINKAQLYYNAVDDKYIIHFKMSFEESHFFACNRFQVNQNIALYYILQ